MDTRTEIQASLFNASKRKANPSPSLVASITKIATHAFVSLCTCIYMYVLYMHMKDMCGFSTYPGWAGRMEMLKFQFNFKRYL